MALLGALTGCTDATSADASPVGEYVLVALNGQAPPADFMWLEPGYHILSASLSIRENGTCAQSSEGDGVILSYPDGCRWELSGDTLTITYLASDRTVQAAWSGNRISYSDGWGNRWVFER